VDWWNEEVGKTASGVRINERLRPPLRRGAGGQPVAGHQVRAEPVAVLGVGGPDVAALQQRLPDDKVPLMMATAGYGFAWKPDNWIFNPRHLPARGRGLLQLVCRRSRHQGPLKVASSRPRPRPPTSTSTRARKKFAKDNKDKVEIVETVYTEAQPSDLTQQVNRVLRKGAQVLQVQNNTASVVATQARVAGLGKRTFRLS
jgi:branched-chain amino acid transport system substrate-binding protein